MSSSSSAPDQHGIGPGENPEANALDGALVDLLDLGLQAKQAHWNITGARFSALHPLLDELAAFARDSADRVAERAVILGHSPDGRPATITSLSTLPPVLPGPLQDGDVIAAFLAILDAMGGRIHTALEAFEKDLVSSALF